MVAYNLPQVINARDSPHRHCTHFSSRAESTSQVPQLESSYGGTAAPNHPKTHPLQLAPACSHNILIHRVGDQCGHPKGETEARQGSDSPRASANQHQRHVGNRSFGWNPTKNEDYLVLNPMLTDWMKVSLTPRPSPWLCTQRATFDTLTLFCISCTYPANSLG